MNYNGTLTAGPISRLLGGKAIGKTSEKIVGNTILTIKTVRRIIEPLPPTKAETVVMIDRSIEVVVSIVAAPGRPITGLLGNVANRGSPNGITIFRAAVTLRAKRLGLVTEGCGP